MEKAHLEWALQRLADLQLTLVGAFRKILKRGFFSNRQIGFRTLDKTLRQKAVKIRIQ
jgi:membrane protein required for beta-lactamase induction